MLVFDSESYFIPVEESEVAAVYRSSATASIGAGESLPSCEAFVCVVSREQRDHVFAALHVKELKRNLIYSLDPSGNLLSSETLLKNAFAFTEAMGFSMDAVNLKYGKAMREVVLRSIPVLLAPECIKKIVEERDAELADLQRLVAESAEKKEAASLDLAPEENGEMKRAREEREIAATAAARKLAMERCADEKGMAIRESVQPFILQVNAAEAAAAERDERERLLRENAAQEKRASELAKTVVRLKAQAETDRSEAEKRAAELEAEVAKTLEEAEAERADRKRIARDKESVEKRMSDLEMMLLQAREEAEGEKEVFALEKESLEKRVLELEKALSEAGSNTEAKNQAAAALAQAEERITRLEQTICEAREVAEAERFERELLVREKAAGEKRITELEKERAGSAGVSESSGGDLENAEVGERLAEAERDADRLLNQLETERSERQRLEAERSVYEKRISEMEEALRKEGAKIHAGNGQISSEFDAAVNEKIACLQRALQRAEERTEFLRLEVDRLALAKALAEKRLMEGAPAPQREPAEPGRVDTPALPVCADPVAAPPKVRRPPPKGAFFHVDWDLDAIEYASPEDILEVHESMNMTQLSLEGYHSQHCSAWIVALEKGGARQVLVAFGLSESGRNLIYSPAKPIRNNDDYKKALREALKFLEVVGYIPEKMNLGKSQKVDALNRIPVLQGSQKRVQGF